MSQWYPGLTKPFNQMLSPRAQIALAAELRNQQGLSALHPGLARFDGDCVTLMLTVRPRLQVQTVMPDTSYPFVVNEV